MTAADADLARAGVGCSGWLFEQVTEGRQEKRAEGIQCRFPPQRLMFVSQQPPCTMVWIDG